MNTVLIGPAEDFKTEAVVKFDGNGRIITNYNISDIQNKPIKIRFYEETITDKGTMYLLDTSSGNTGFLVRRFGLGVTVAVYDNRSMFIPTSSTSLQNGWNTVEILVVGAQYTITVNGVDEIQPDFNGSYVTGAKPLEIGANVDSVTNKFTGYISLVSIGDELIYDLSSQFGNPTVLDSSGNNYTGTIESTFWWRVTDEDEPFDELFDTEQLYKNTWDVPMLESQTMWDLLKNYTVEDAFWNDYNIDGVHTFEILYQNNNELAIQILILNKSGGNMISVDTITGTQVIADNAGAGLIQELSEYVTQINASTEVTMNVVLTRNAASKKLTPIKTLALETFYDVAEIWAIDMDSIVGDLNTVVFGITK